MNKIFKKSAIFFLVATLIAVSAVCMTACDPKPPVLAPENSLVIEIGEIDKENTIYWNYKITTTDSSVSHIYGKNGAQSLHDLLTGAKASNKIVYTFDIKTVKDFPIITQLGIMKSSDTKSFVFYTNDKSNAEMIVESDTIVWNGTTFYAVSTEKNGDAPKYGVSDLVVKKDAKFIVTLK